jgi:hypothetical protein
MNRIASASKSSVKNSSDSVWEISFEDVTRSDRRRSADRFDQSSSDLEATVVV